MIYCNRTSKTKTSGTYSFGMNAENLSGVITFSKDSFEIEKWPDEGENCKLWLRKLIAKHRGDFQKGVFRKKLAYEC